MTSAGEVEDWFHAVNLYDEGKFEEAIKSFKNIPQNAKTAFNIGCSYLTLGNVQLATKSYRDAITFDPFMAITYYMLGLTNCLEKDYVGAFEDFQKAIDLLRGKRVIDYRQLGLKIQLYLCEILTNQAVTYYHRKIYDKAKQLLLLAVGCKVEKRHDSIVDFLCNLQAGYPIKLYTPAQNAIYRPLKSSVDNFAKRDFLGKATVIATENEESIYTCFSGLKDSGTLQGRLKVPDRQVMLEELRQPERRATLNKAGRPPKKQLPQLQIVPESNINLPREFPTAVSPLPIPKPRSTPNSLGTTGTINSNNPTPSPRPLKPLPNIQIDNISSEQDVGGDYEYIDRKAFSEYQKISVKSFGDDSPGDYNSLISQSQENTQNNVQLTNSRSNGILENITSSRFFPFKQSGETTNKSENITKSLKKMTKSKFYSNETSKDSKSLGRECNSELNTPVYEIEVQYTFIQKVQIHANFSFAEVENLIKSQTVPQKIELCYNDDLGRQQKLSEKNLHELFGTDTRKKLLCFSA